MAGFFFTGEQDLTPEGLDRKRALLNALRKENLSTAPVGHWTQALARVVGAGADSMEEAQLNRTEKAQTEKARTSIKDELVRAFGGAASPGAPTAAAGVPASAPVAAPSVANITPPPTTSPAPSTEAQGEKPSDNELVIRTIAAEASGKSPQEAQAIANVILNRAKGRNLTPGDVVLERNQFEPWNGGPGGRNDPMAIDPNSPRYKQAQQALAAALQGDVTNGATHFYAPVAQAALGRPAPAWARGPGQRIGATAFYAPEGRVTGGEIPTAPQPASAAPVQSDALAPAAAPAQFNVPGQVPATPPQPNLAKLMAALENPWAARSPALMQLAASVAGKQLSRDPVDDALKRVQLQQAMRELEQPKAEWGVIAEDEFGNKKYGWIDKNARTTTPGQPSAPTQGAQPPIAGPPMPGQPAPAQGIPPAPPGANPKVWRDEQTKKMVNPEKLTEVQSKDLNFYQRGVPANEILSKVEKALTNPLDPTLAKLPGGNYTVSKDFQIAQNAAKDFLAVILRKDTGAAVTESEVETYGKIFLPERGDAPETITQKREARARALEGIRLGLGSAKELVEFARPKGQQAAKPEGAPMRINSPAEAAKLPKGTRFVDPNGIERIVP